MIATKFRIPRQEIPYILKKGASIKSALFIVRQVPNKTPFDRYRTIVSKKMDRSAVGRNKLRRRIYSAIQENIQQDFPDEKTQKHDIILIPQKKIVTASFQAITEDINQITNGKI